jgi:hypothetical protein
LLKSPAIQCARVSKSFDITSDLSIMFVDID